MSDTPQKATTGADIIAAIKWCHSRAEERHQEMMTALAEMKAAKPAASSPAPAGGRKFSDPPETETIRGYVVKDGVKISDKQARVKIDVNGNYLAVINRGHRREEIRALELCEGDLVEFIAETPQEKEWAFEGKKGKNWEAIAHGCKVLKKVEQPKHQDSYADFGAPRAEYSATGHAIPGTSADDTEIPF